MNVTCSLTLAWTFSMIGVDVTKFFCFVSIVMRHPASRDIQRQGQLGRGVRLHVRVLVEVRRMGLGGVAELAPFEAVIVAFFVW